MPFQGLRKLTFEFLRFLAATILELKKKLHTAHSSGTLDPAPGCKHTTAFGATHLLVPHKVSGGGWCSERQLLKIIILLLLPVRPTRFALCLLALHCPSRVVI